MPIFTHVHCANKEVVSTRCTSFAKTNHTWKHEKNSQHCGTSLHTSFDERYKINGSLWTGSNMDWEPWKKKKRKTKKHPPTWEGCGVSVKEMYASVSSFCLIYGCQRSWMEGNRSKNAAIIIALNIGLQRKKYLGFFLFLAVGFFACNFHLTSAVSEKWRFTALLYRTEVNPAANLETQVLCFEIHSGFPMSE